MISKTFSEDTISFYLDLKPDKIVDLEVAAKAAIEWSRAVKAAAMAADPTNDYRVSLVAAEPGSSRWLARLESSKANQIAKDIQSGWEQVPLIFRHAVALAVVIPVTAYPTYDFYFGDDGFSETQMHQLEEIFEKATKDPTVKAHQQQMYREVQRDPNITALGGGVPDGPDWKPPEMIPANRFAEAEGLFEPKDEKQEGERTIPKTLDVILVTPRLENAQRAWSFRQEGIPGTFNAEMKDAKFLAALEQSGIQERLRANIPMRIRLEIKEEMVNGEWRVKRRGRSVVEVLSPSPDASYAPSRNATRAQ
ncbi:hypothetical protein OE699_02100 [Sedimentimonas flavescens]|uniref:Uncharacterized protein n=1 Tax=Sedimentimonas flavescens TaxID=2851012 RepID=A0ABT2ZV62_9RHOB|nr:hypothetical protein [Sedimentimonas flavescens]MCV2877632.1 hypothetical protein [Sedimentimonas flavescens]